MVIELQIFHFNLIYILNPLALERLEKEGDG